MIHLSFFVTFIAEVNNINILNKIRLAIDKVKGKGSFNQIKLFE